MKKTREFKGRFRNSYAGSAIVLLALVIAIFLTFIYTNHKNKNSNIDMITLVTEEVSQNTAVHIQDVFADHMSSIKVSASLYGTSLKSAEVDVSLLKKLENTTSFDYIRFIDTDGIDYASDGAIANCSDRDYFKRGINEEQGMCEVLKSRINGERLIGFYSPVYYENELCGVMVGFLKEDTISGILHTEIFGHSTSTFLVRDDGVIVGQSRPEGAKKLDDMSTAYEYFKGEQYDRAREAFHNRISESFTIKGFSGYNTVCYITPVSESQWVIIQVFPEEVAVEMLKDVTLNFNSSLLIVIILFIAALTYFYITYRRTGRLYTEYVVSKEREKKQIQIDLIFAAAKTVYPYIITQNLTLDRVVAIYNETGIKDSDNLEEYSVGDMMKTVLKIAPQLEDKKTIMSVYSRDALMQAYEEGRTVVTSRMQQEFKDGIHWTEITAILIKADDGDIYSIAMLRVIDDEILKNNELIEAKEAADAANRSKSQFLANMSHEIRTPINAILGMNTMVLREADSSAVREYAYNVQEAGNILLNLINDILDFSKIESGKIAIIPDDYELSSLINDLVNMIKPKTEEKGLALKLDIDEKLPEYLYGDVNRVKQIILNILNNAVKYTQQGQITFTMKCKRDFDSSVDILVSVKDTGMGIRKENLEQLFNPYTRLEESAVRTIEGTGLGMTITKSLLKRMGSDIYVESEFGVGSEFYFTLKQMVRKSDRIGDFAKRAKDAEDSLAVAKERFHAPNAKILVVDDVEMNLLVVVNLLKRIHIQIDEAMSGQEAISMANENKYDLILLDAMMPRMSGSETMRHIRRYCELNRKTPIVVMTANAVVGAREEYIGQGFDDYIAKPISSELLEQCLLKYLPDELILDASEDSCEEEKSPEKEAVYRQLADKISAIKEIDTKKGIEASGSLKSYVDVTRLFYDSAREKMGLIESYFIRRDYDNYTIQVHALKSTARLIGAIKLSEEAKELEMAGKVRDFRTISDNTGRLLTDYEDIYRKLSEYFDNSDSNKEGIDINKLNKMLKELIEAIEGYDYDTASMIVEAFGEYSLPDDFKEIYKNIKSRLADVDGSAILALVKGYMS